jgi:hypothetical protein
LNCDDLCFPRRSQGAAGDGDGVGKLLDVDSLRDRERRGRQTTRQREGRKRGPEESGGVLNHADYGRNSTAFPRFSGERFLHDGGVSGSISRGRWKRRVGALIG